MEEPKNKYILLHDRVGYTVERSLLALGLSKTSTPTNVLRGELLEAIPEAEQPSDLTRIALVGIERKALHLECRTEDLTRLPDEDANLLLAISSLELRYQTFIDRKRLAFGRRLLLGNQVLVSVKGISKHVPGVVWYKGELPSNAGTMFGVELIKNRGQGTSDGTFRNKKYFSCPPDSGVFVGLDKLSPPEDPDSKSPPKSPKRDENAQANFKSRLKDTVVPSFLKGKSEQKLHQDRTDKVLKIYQRVVAFIGDHPVRGTVRYIGEEKDPSGKTHTIVGLEMDERVGSGTGKRNGQTLFACKRDFAGFVDLETVIPEEDFDENPTEENPTGKKAFGKEVLVQEQIRSDEFHPKSMSYGYRTPAGESVKKARRTNSFDSADVIKAAGESSQTDPSAFIEQQRQMLEEMKNAKSSRNRDNNEDVDMRDEDRTSQIDFQDDHFKNTPPNSSIRDNGPITTQPGLSNAKFKSQETARKTSYPDYVHIEKDDYEQLMGKHEGGRHGDAKGLARSNLQNSATHSNRCSDEVMHLQQGLDGTKRPSLVTEVVSDCSPRTSDEMDDASKEPSVQQEIQPTILQSEDLAAGKKTGIESNQMAVDIPHGLEVGSMVEVPMAEGFPRYGVIRWLGNLPQLKDKLVAGLELEEEQSACSDGVFNGDRYFTCPAGRGFFTLLEHCRQDSRFAPNTPNSDTSFNADKAFGSLPSPDYKGITAPPKTLDDKQCGTMRGLQGHHNSCYLDATLYAMFSFSSVFDTLLHRLRRNNDLEEYDKVQTVLREWIVNPLRVYGFVRADRVLVLRELLDKLSSTAGLVNEEKDPEEFLNSLLQQVLKADPFLHLKQRDVQEKDSEGAFFYQIITEKDETVKIAEVQNLLEQSFISADLILSEVPSCLILQMPRFGSRYKMYDMILPNLELDVSHIVENVPRECTMCGSDVALHECKKCYQKGLLGDGPGIASYCKECNKKVHSNPRRADHKPRPILLPRVYRQYSNEKETRKEEKNEQRRLDIDKQKMDLFAVVCIETSHYVAFVKCGVGADAPWCFFDSMADRKGERNGYNIPAVTPCPEALEWLSKDTAEILAAKERGEIPEKVRRLLGDGYLCMYQNLDMTMYK
ncbi:ubiquitin carboxyl-terminal hydrolase CYLD-like [Oculina patagonica]